MKEYSDYKPSNVSWLQSIPSHWQQKRLKFAVSLINQKQPAEEAEVPYIGLEHIESWTGRKIDGEISQSEGLASAYTRGDVLFGKLRPYLAKVHLAEEPGLISSEALVIRATDGVLPSYLKYYFLSRDFIDTVDSSTYGSKMPRANWDYIGNLTLLIPSEREQQAIVRFLDHKTAQIDALIAKKQALLDKLAEQRTALISQAVTQGLDLSVPMVHSGVDWLGEIPAHWNAIRVRHISEFVTSGSRGWAQYYSNEGNIFLRITNVSRHSVNLLQNDIQRVSPPESAEGNRTKTQSGDVIVSITADLGSVAVIPEDYDEAYVSQHLALIRPQIACIYPRWLAYQIFSQHGKAQLIGAGYGGTKIQLSLPDIKDLWVALPPLDTQEEICSEIDKKVEKLELRSSKVQKAIEKLEEYRSALITNAITGKIDVRNFTQPTPAEAKEAVHE
ncbi:restriction endonuclease subunit S [Oceanimonas smirnovii]|uniref:restriction endonuclease subunit S n=1 Tax=Oceanimonas smirnovii TaxID=264574 RepID=UPI003AB018B3